MAVRISFEITGRPETVLRRIAGENGLLPEQYAENIVSSFLASQTRGIFLDEFNKKTEDELAETLGEISEVRR